MKRKRQLFRAKLSNMLLSLDKTISFHLCFKESKFGKNSAKHGERRKPSQKNMKGKDKKHLTFFWR